MAEGTAAVARSAYANVDLHEIVQLLEKDQLAQAIERLEGMGDAGAEAEALLGAAYFRGENYARAQQCFQRALDKGHPDVGLLRLLARARANEHTDVRRHVPEPAQFDKDALLAGPQPGAAAPRLSPVPEHSLLERALDAIGGIAGLKFGQTIGVLTRFFPEPPSHRLWTTWYRRNLVRATLMLANRRDRLNKRQLFPVYPRGEGVGFFRSAQAAPEWARWARTADGSWNDLSEPMAGASGTRFGANTDPTRTPGERGERLLTPNPRTVSRVLLTRNQGLKPIPFLNLNAASWIQFMTHDWVSYGDAIQNAPPYRVELDADDPARRLLHQTHMLVRPTQPDVTSREGEPGPTHINEVTSWWDGSQIYGSDARTQHSLRSHYAGRLKLDEATGLLPLWSDGVEHTGFRRNWWLGLTMLHTLFAREHNAICDMLSVHYPSWSDQRLFDTARLITAAVMAKIHTVEWTPAILPNLVLNSAMNANWYGLVTNLFRSKRDRQTLARINIHDPIAGGIVGNATDNHGVPYALTREFTSVYRLHSLLPDEIGVYRVGRGDQRQQSYGLAELRQAASPQLTRSIPMADWFYSFGVQHPGQLVLNNYPETLQNLSIPGFGFYDLGAVDVLRDRERGVPRYNQFRKLIGLKPLYSFADLTTDRAMVQALQQVYASIEDVDLLVGNLAETTRPEGFGFGETLFEVFILNASRRLQADRFFTSDYNPDVYTPEGLRWVDDVTFKSVLLRHYPALSATGLANVDNAFEPWDVGELDPKRHPLRQFDLELREYDDQRKQRS
jgi:hypothetical protein